MGVRGVTYGVGKSEGEGNLEDLEVDGRIIFKWILNWLGRV
jgi:hypothetical protein